MLRLIFIVAWWAMLTACQIAASETAVQSPDRLTCESLVAPLSIDAAVPRLSWELNDSRRGAAQTAYRVLAASSRKNLDEGKGDLWDSGTVVSDQSVFVPYQGCSLPSFQDVFWKVRVKDQDGIWTPWSKTAIWRMGVLNSKDWKNARWIGLNGDPRDNSSLTERTFAKPNAAPKPTRTFPSPLLRKEFRVGGPVKKATAYVCGLGYFELYVNGAKMGDHVLDPVQTSYDQYACYVTFDITAALNKGRNAVGLMLGNGFYGQNFAFQPFRMFYGEPLAVALLRIEYEDGAMNTIVTGPDWKGATGPVLFDNVYAGETYDARLEIPGWSCAGFDDKKWEPVEVRTAPAKRLAAQSIPPMKKIRAVKPVAVSPARNGGWILDMGQNMTGWLQIRVQGSSGREIRMRFAETLMPGGDELDTLTTGTYVTGADQTDVYVCNGDGIEVWEPRFTYHGFRYVQIDGLPGKPDLDNFTGWLVRTDVPRIGRFQCSDPLLNTFYRVSMWTLEDNLQGILTDCPARERCEWMGDMVFDGETASCSFDLSAFWRKTSADIGLSRGTAGPQKTNLPKDVRAPANVAVGRRACGQARPDWGMAAIMVPWFDYLYYGDLRTVEEAWPAMQGWMAFLEEHGMSDGIIEEGYGDWCQPGSRHDVMDTPVALTSTALYYQGLTVMQTLADALGRDADRRHCAALAATVRSAFNRHFHNPSSGDYGTQTGNALALSFGLVPDDLRSRVGQGLKTRILTNHNGHHACGIMGHRYLYTVLNDNGMSDITRLLWSQTDWPSPGYLTETMKMTTWLEHSRDMAKGDRFGGISLNHPMQAGFSASFYESVGGIRPDPECPGFKKIIFQPCFLPDLQWVRTEHRSLYGLISSDWKKEDGWVLWTVTVPPNTTAIADAPQGWRFADGTTRLELVAGSYKLKLLKRRCCEIGDRSRCNISG